MARCEICHRTGQSGNNVSHSKRRTKTRWSTNVHKGTVYTGGLPRQVNICTRCLRSRYRSRVRS